jgi:GT2 family glycosyltransferase
MIDVVMCVVNWSTPADLLRLMGSADEWEEGQVRWSIYWNHHDAMDVENSQIRTDIHNRYSGRVVSQVSTENHGHGYGINRAVDAATVMWDPQFVFAINPDCAFIEPVLCRLTSALDEDPARFAVGPKQMNSQHKITAGGITGKPENPIPRFWQKHDPRNEVGIERVVGPMVSGSAFVVRTPDFYEYGGMLETAHYYSETWLMYHATAHGRECWYIGDARMIHEWHRSSRVGSPLTDGRMAEDRERFRAMCDAHDPPIPRD